VVDQQCTTRKGNELTMGSRVPSCAAAALLPGLQMLVAEQPVRERRLADTRGAEQADRPPSPQIAVELLEAVARLVGDGTYSHVRRERLQTGEQVEDVGVEVELRQH